MVKLLIMNDYVHDGGVEKVMEELVNYLPEENYDITIASTISDYESIKNFYPSHVRYLSLEKAFKRAKRKNLFSKTLNFFKRRFFKLVYKFKINISNYDVVIAFKEGQCMQFLSKIKAKKKYAWIHVDYNYLHWTKAFFRTNEKELDCMNGYDNVICVSEVTKKSVCDVVGNPGNLIVKANPIDTNEIIEKSQLHIKCLEEYEISTDKLVLLTVGGLREPKGYMRLLEVCNKLNGIHTNYELWIIGDGPMRDKMESYIKANNLSNVILWGSQSNPYPFIKRADWFVSSSFTESFGIAVQESLILNVPVIATECPAFEEFISKKECMFVENSIDGLYIGLNNILQNPDLKNKYKEEISKLRTYQNLYICRLEGIEELWKKKR